MSFERTTPPAWTIHPGEILEEEFLKPTGMSGYALAKSLHVAPQVINDIVLQKRGISPENALRLAKFFSTTAEFWMGLQNSYELGVARKSLKKKIGKIRPRSAA
jgi:addiction module HigA family antidote